MPNTKRLSISTVLFSVVLFCGIILIAAVVCAFFYFIAAHFFLNMGTYQWDKLHQNISAFEKVRRFLYASIYFILWLSSKLAAIFTFGVCVFMLIKNGIDEIRGKTKRLPAEHEKRIVSDVYDKAIAEMQQAKQSDQESKKATDRSSEG
ncbi:MAG TPA: hypothetical protein P5567_11430 [Kiritimatiellia bacterium]|nr:hypothetical protein [Kiritimatiellia bacterium]HSA17471.1 hypothetical protein [Kiritimatiellia bacterium]